jgi:hypothetical protein
VNPRYTVKLRHFGFGVNPIWDVIDEDDNNVRMEGESKGTRAAAVTRANEMNRKEGRDDCE